MATLKTSGQTSALTARSRLKYVVQDRPVPPKASPVVAAARQTVDNAFADSHEQRLSEIEQRHLLLQAVTIYSGWCLVSVQQRPETDTLVANLVRSSDQGDVVAAIHEGRSIQIIMDAVGDLKVQYGRRQSRSWLKKLFSFFTGRA